MNIDEPIASGAPIQIANLRPKPVQASSRPRAGLSQSEVAQRMGTTQSVVARLESGKRPPSMRTVERFAQAVGGHLVFRIEQQASA